MARSPLPRRWICCPSLSLELTLRNSSLVSPLNIGIQLASLRMPLKQALQSAASLHVQGVEIDARHMLRPQDLSATGIRHFRKTLSELNLRVCAVGFPTRRGYNIPEDLDRRIEATKEAMQFAYQLGARVLVNHVGQIPEENQGAEWDLLVEVLSDLGRFGQHVGVTLAAETGAESGERMADLLASLTPGAVGVNYDPGGLVVNGYSPRDALTSLVDHVVHVHATDGVRDRAQGRGIETLLGRGSADFPELMAILEERHYSGFFTVERRQPSEPLAEVRQGVEYLKNLAHG
jgi:sugar phosphate isomerase/epimerase